MNSDLYWFAWDRTFINKKGSTEQKMPPQGKPCFGEFKCQKCKSFWKSSKAFENEEQKCKNCKTMVMASSQRPLKQAKKVFKTKEEMHLTGIGPFFGEFNCRKCQKHWYSAYCWFEKEEKGKTPCKIPQKCKTCNINAYAVNMRPLEKQETETTKPHKTDLCGQCKRLGYTCEQLKSKQRTGRKFADW